MERLYTKDDLLLILNYLRAINDINSQHYRSLKNSNIKDLSRFLYNIGMIKGILV